MATRKLEHSEWQVYFNWVAQGIRGVRVEIEVAGLKLGHQIEADWVALTGLTYDPKGDLFEIATESIDHLVHQPREIYVEDDIEGLHTVEIVDIDGNHQIIKLKSPLALQRG